MGGRFKRDGIYVYILTADSCCCTAETNTTLQSNYLPIQNLKKKIKIDDKEIQRKRSHLKQKHYFTNKGPFSQSYGFSSSHVWM